MTEQDTRSIAPASTDMGAIERVIATGDLARLTSDQRTAYYLEVCRSLHLNALTKPFDFLVLNGKMVLYATRGCTDQLRKIHHVSTQIVSRETVGDVYVVTARATDREGRTDESIGAVSIAGHKGEALCNQFMKAETKSKRRATLALIGLSFLDESELDTLPDARHVGHAHLEEPPPAAIESPSGESERMRALRAEMDAAIAEGDAVPGWRVESPAPVVYAPADDVEFLVGKALGDACARMRRSMEARSLPLPPDPVPRNSNEAWRRWWHACRAVMNAAEAAAPHGAPQGVAG